RVGQRGEQGRPGPVVDQHRDRDLRELITRVGQHLSEPQPAELADREYLAVGGLFFRCPPVPPRGRFPAPGRSMIFMKRFRRGGGGGRCGGPGGVGDDVVRPRRWWCPERRGTGSPTWWHVGLPPRPGPRPEP